MASDGEPPFVEVLEQPVRAAGMEECGFEVQAPNGWRLRVGGQFDPGGVARLLEIMARCY